MTDQEILNNAPEGALGIKIFDGFYRWILKDNTMSKIYDCEGFNNINQIYRSLADIKRIAELEKVLKLVHKDLLERAWVDTTDGYKVVALGSSIWQQLKEALKEQGDEKTR